MILAYLTGTWRTLAAAAAACLLCLTVGYCKGDSARAAKGALAVSRANEAALRIARAADTIAAAERAADVTTTLVQEKERQDAIQTAPPSRPGAATRALGCARVRIARGDQAARAAGC